ncbi:Lrp/AsnC family transcriptional regulator [Echinicola shivajiensis]|uniref:Lrp/AsnC family transcriptional regulator n=1 Tax=Echinicola shivajiensis TaxID=1035916 RepID=UPI001BFC20FF|nr:Lrp/AsnC family transcriptional regulator [Echinicola shivajiensis]
MDKVDKKILAELQKNAKQNTKEIASKIGLSVTPTYERIKKLEKQGIIKTYVALVDRIKIGKEIEAYCQITMARHQKGLLEDINEKVLSFPEVMECHHVSGNYDFLLKVVVDDIHAFHHFINEKLIVVEGISTIHSAFVMHSIKENTAYSF